MDKEHKILLKNLYACFGGAFRKAQKRLQADPDGKHAATVCDELASTCRAHFEALDAQGVEGKAEVCLPYFGYENGNRLWDSGTATWGPPC